MQEHVSPLVSPNLFSFSQNTNKRQKEVALRGNCLDAPLFTHLAAFIEHPLRARLSVCCTDVIVEEGSIHVLKELSVQ